MIARLTVLLITVLGLSGCAQLRMFGVQTRLISVDTRVDDRPAAQPDILGPFGDDPAVTSVEDWTQRRAPLLRAAFEREIYGPMPPSVPVREVERRLTTADAYGGLARVEDVTLEIGPEEGPLWSMRLAVVTPLAALEADQPPPVILAQNFCGNHVAVPDADVAPPLVPYPEACESAFWRPVIGLLFGEHNGRPPLRAILEAGFAYVSQYPGEIVPDSRDAAAANQGLLATLTSGEDTPGAVIAWAWAYSRALDYLLTRDDLDAAQTSVWGHSRNGKSTLLAAAFDQRIAAVIAHQSGTAGGTLSRSDAGESVAAITGAFPHWFAERFAGYADREDALPVDQHQLLGLIAPRPVFLGNARRDVWSDPNGSFRAAQGAQPVYALFGAEGLTQTSLTETDYGADLVFFLRSGGHGVNAPDWEAFLSFLQEHTPPASQSASGL